MTDRELMQQALEALVDYIPQYDKRISTITALRERLAREEQEPVAWMTLNAYGEEDDICYENPEGKLLEGWTYKPLYTAPQPAAQIMRVPEKGDRVICIEDESIGTVWWTSAGGGPYIKFDDGSYGQWSLREFGDLFRYEQPAREWQGLTEDEIQTVVNKVASGEYQYSDTFARAIEAKLREKNT